VAAGVAVKATLWLAAIMALSLIFFFYRRRLRLALLVGGGLYIGLTALRLLWLHEEVDRLTELALAIGLLGGLWLTVNLIVTLVQRYRPPNGR
jgi:hypothetical protein